jgi:hypothetical protein
MGILIYLSIEYWMNMLHLITVQELNSFKSEVDAAVGCTMLVWVTNNGMSPLAYIIPGQPILIVPTPSTNCPAYSFYATKN